MSRIEEAPIARQIALCFGCGRLQPMPGTWTSAIALAPAALIVWLLGHYVLLLAIVVVSLTGLWAAQRYSEITLRKDPSEVVIDEVAGQWIAVLPLCLDWRAWLFAFVLFRIFDITKIWPLRRLERLPGGLGIMADDLLAGVYAAIVGALIAWWWGEGLLCLSWI